MLKGKKAVLFDMDGTLIDSVGVWNDIDRELILALGGDEQDGSQIQKQRDRVLREHSASPNPYTEYCRYLKEKTGTELSADDIIQKRYAIAKDYLKSRIDYKENAEKLLYKLRDMGFTLIIASTTKKSNMDVYRGYNKNIMEKAPIDELFSAVYTREDVSNIKPSPEVYERIFQDMELAAGECLVFEDSLVGVEAAKAAEIEVAVVYDKYSDAERDAINALADYTFADFAEILTTVTD